MAAGTWVDGSAHRAFAAQGLENLDALCASTRGVLVSRARTRTCRRVELEGKGYYVKVQVVPPRVLPLRRWPSYLAKGSPLVREARNLGILAQLGLAVPPVCYHGGDRRWWGLPRRAALVTREVVDHVDLARLTALEPDRAAAAAAAVEERVTELHRLGWVLGGVKYRNVLVGPAGELVWLDLPDLVRTASKRGRRRDRRILGAERSRLLAGRVK